MHHYFQLNIIVRHPERTKLVVVKKVPLKHPKPNQKHSKGALLLQELIQQYLKDKISDLVEMFF